MSLHRQAAKRDNNEPAIRARLRAHGWHTEQVSGKGLADLIGWSKQRVDVLLLEVKMPGKGPTPAQVTKWTELLTRGIRVYVLHTPNDVDYLVKGRLEPWTPSVPAISPKRTGQDAKTPGGMRVKDCGCLRVLGRCEHSGTYAPLGSTAIAAETFAPMPPCEAKGQPCTLRKHKHAPPACPYPACSGDCEHAR